MEESCMDICEHELRELLAIIHRDGGHYVSEHGLQKACADAQARVHEWLRRDDADAHRDSLYGRK